MRPSMSETPDWLKDICKPKEIPPEIKAADAAYDLILATIQRNFKGKGMAFPDHGWMCGTSRQMIADEITKHLPADAIKEVERLRGIIAAQNCLNKTYSRDPEVGSAGVVYCGECEACKIRAEAQKVREGERV